MKKYLVLVILTTISGILSWCLPLIMTQPKDRTMFFTSGAGLLLSGLIFGVILGIYFYKFEKITIKNAFRWSVNSLGASFVAFMYLELYGIYKFMTSPAWSGNPAPQTDNLIFELFVAGMLGAFMLAAGTNLPVVKLSTKQKLIVALLGGVIGIIFSIVSGSSLLGSEDPNLPLMTLSLIVWQVAIGTTLGIMVDRNKKLLTNDLTNNLQHEKTIQIKHQ